MASEASCGTSQLRSGPAEEQSTDYAFWGVVLCEVAVVFIALGANVQRLGLIKISPSRKACKGCRCVCATQSVRKSPLALRINR